MTRTATTSRSSSVLLIATLLVSLIGCGEIAATLHPPVQVRLTPYLIANGYYVEVVNMSEHQTLYNVTVTYRWQGLSLDQTVGTIAPRTAKTIDPWDANYRVQKNEQIQVSADGYISKTIDTNTLID